MALPRAAWIGGGACIAIAVAVLAWRSTRDTPAQPTAPAPTKRVERMAVDVAKFKAMRQALIDRAKELAARRPAPPPARPASTERDERGRPLTASLISPACKVGPAELCETIADIVADCDAKDGQACLAVGQLLADTPPRSMLARVFFTRACEAGEQEACARVKLLEGTEPVACETDVFACGWRAWKANDPVALEEACAYGVSEACIQLVPIGEGDRVKGRAYLEHGCQLGDPNACEGLGFMLSAACNDPTLCFPPDPEQSKAAYAIACAAGWESSCNK